MPQIKAEDDDTAGSRCEMSTSPIVPRDDSTCTPKVEDRDTDLSLSDAPMASWAGGPSGASATDGCNTTTRAAALFPPTSVTTATLTHGPLVGSSRRTRKKDDPAVLTRGAKGVIYLRSYRQGQCEKFVETRTLEPSQWLVQCAPPPDADGAETTPGDDLLLRTRMKYKVQISTRGTPCHCIDFTEREAPDSEADYEQILEHVTSEEGELKILGTATYYGPEARHTPRKLKAQSWAASRTPRKTRLGHTATGSFTTASKFKKES